MRKKINKIKNSNTVQTSLLEIDDRFEGLHSSSWLSKFKKDFSYLSGSMFISIRLKFK